jgi:hypothetical protein
MALPITIKDGGGSGKYADVAQKNGHKGVVAYTEPLIEKSLFFAFATDDDGSSAMNINVTFGGTPEGVHNGGDNAYWTASALSGTWDFASATNPANGAACVEKITTTNGDQALFTDATTTDFGSYTALTGKVRLEKVGPTYEILLQFRLAGVLVGSSVDLYDYVDRGTLNAYQAFAIPKEDFGIASETVDELEVTCINKPQFRLDDLQIEETGSPVIYKMRPPKNTRVFIEQLRFSIADDVTSVVTNGTMPGLSYDSLLGLSSLTNGIVVRATKDRKIDFGISIRNIGDSLKSGGTIESPVSDGTNTCITLVARFPAPIVLNASADDSIDVVVSDDLSGLLSLNALFIGKQQDMG